MELANYKITFKAEIVPGYELAKVKQGVASLFKLDDQQLSNFFSGYKVTLKQNITKAQAQKYAGILQSLGLIVYLEEDAIEIDIFEQDPEDIKVSPVSVTSKDINKIVSAQQANRLKQHTEEPILAFTIFGFDFFGRCGRLNYLNADLIMLLLLAASIFLLSIPILGPFVLVIAVAFLIFFAVRITILRLHDLDMSAGLTLLILVPVVNLIFHVLLLLLPGTGGTNSYGSPVRQGSILGLIIALAGISALIIATPIVKYLLPTL